MKTWHVLALLVVGAAGAAIIALLRVAPPEDSASTAIADVAEAQDRVEDTPEPWSEPPPSVAVVVRATGLSPTQTDDQVAYPVEVALLGVADVSTVSCTARAGEAVCIASFPLGTDPFIASRRVVDALAAMRSTLPDGCVPAVFLEPRPEPAARWVLAGDLPGNELRALADDVIRPALLRIPGVADVSVCGGSAERVTVSPDDERLAAFGLDGLTLRRALADAFVGASALGAAEGSVETLGDVALRPGVTVRDVADIRLEAAPLDCAALQAAGPVVSGEVRARTDSHPEDAALERLVELASTLPPGVTLRIVRDVAARLVLWLPGSDEQAVEAVRRMAPTDASWLATVPADGGTVTLLVWADDTPLAPTRADALVDAALALPGARLAAIEGAGVGRTLTLRLSAADRDILAAAAAKVAQDVAQAPGVRAAVVLGAPETPTTSIVPDRSRMAAFGLSARDLAEVLSQNHPVAVIRRRGRPCEVHVAPPPTLQGAVLRTASGTLVRVADVTTTTLTAEPGALSSKDGRPSLDVAVHLVRDASPRAAHDAIERSLDLPPGVTPSWTAPR